MEAATNNKRGRPCAYTELLYAALYEEEKRPAQNKYHAGATVSMLQQQPGDFFITDKGNFRRQGIAEQIGRMIYEGYPEEFCKKVAETAIELYKKGVSVKALEKWIRTGRKTGEW